MAEYDQMWFRRVVELVRRNVSDLMVGNMYGSRRNLLDQLYLLTVYRNGQLPNLRDIFQGEEIDWILSESVKSVTPSNYHILPPDLAPLIDFVISTGYKDEPKLGPDGKPLLHRTTALHRAAYCEGWRGDYLVNLLFRIYNRFDVNYVSEGGITHFHLACKSGCYEAARQFLKSGQDPNCLATETGDSPLHLALIGNRKKVAKLLLNYGADPNLANKSGWTPLHFICCISELESAPFMPFSGAISEPYDKFLDTIFKICDAKRQTVQVDARNESGETPLYLVLKHNKRKLAEVLLRRGANPNPANEDGSTPLHLICMSVQEDEFVEFFFKIVDDKGQPLEVDARDKKGRTPLEYAVTHLLPNTVELLLEHGADVSNFVFPDESQLGERRFGGEDRLTMACRILICAQSLEDRGYELDRDDVLAIMKLYRRYTRYDLMHVVGRAPVSEHEKYLAEKEKVMNKGKGLSFYDLIHLEPEEAAKRGVYKECYDLTRSKKYRRFSDKFRSACADHLCDMLPRRLFLRWALDPFMELINYRLPHLPCDMILDNLNTVDLHSICLAASGKNS